MHITELIDSIRGQLDGRASSVATEVLALEYAKQCREVNERLSKIGLMLEGGGEIQALQLAEQPPRVVDAALGLSFGGESAWQEFCRNHGHEVAPLIDARTLESLLSLQSKGIASNHPLYKDYRAAVSSRDDERAHDLIRVIARLNPSDGNAAKELKRLQRKVFQTALTNLRANLEGGDDPLLAAMTDVEEAGIPEDYEQLPEWKQASAHRGRVRRTAAWKRMPEALAGAEEQLESGDWRQAAVLHGEYAVLTGTHGHGEETAKLEERAALIQVQLEKHRSEAERVAKARHLVAEMERIADDVEIRMVTPLGLSPDFAGPLVEDLTRKIRQIEGLRGEFPNNARLRIDAARAQLAQALERANRSRRMRLVGGLVAVAVILLASAVIGTLVFRASNHADLLASLRDKQSASGLRDLVDRITNDEPILLKFPGLSSEVAQAIRWLEATDAKRSLVDQELAVLDRERQDDFAEVSSPDLFAKLQEIGALISELPLDLVSEASSRLTVLRNDGERVLTKRQDQNDQRALEAVSRWAEVLKKIDLSGPASEAAAAISAAEAELAPFVKLASLEQPLLRLPASTEALITDVESRGRQMLDRVAAVSSALAALAAAETSDSYRDAVRKLSACSFSEGAAAQRIIDAWPDDERVKAMLVFRGDLVALKSASIDGKSGAPTPEAADASDRETISALASSEVLNTLWEVIWKDNKGVQQTCLSKGELARSGTEGRKGELARYPKLIFESLRFVERSILPQDGNVVISNKPTATTEMMSRLGLTRILDDTGMKFRESVIPLLDTVGNDTKAKPLVKAYVFGQLLRLISNHKPEEWGLFYCPGLIDDIRAFEKLAMKAPLLESAWLLEKEQESAEQWRKYFENRGKESIFAELIKTRGAAKAVIRNPVDLAGYVAADGKIILKPAPVTRLILAVCDLGEGVQALKVCGMTEASGEGIAASPSNIAPLSPLLSISLTEETQSFLLAVHLGKRPAASNPTEP
jgi:hypothetical protein